MENTDSLIEYLLNFNIDLTSEVVTQVIGNISLTERKDFLKLPSKFRKEDVYHGGLIERILLIDDL